MAMTYAAITGRILVPGSTSIGVLARLTATPVPHPALVFPAEDRITWGPASTTTGIDGRLSPALQIPLSSEDPGVMWSLTLTPLDPHSGLSSWALGTFTITADADLAQLVAA